MHAEQTKQNNVYIQTSKNHTGYFQEDLGTISSLVCSNKKSQDMMFFQTLTRVSFVRSVL